MFYFTKCASELPGDRPRNHLSSFFALFRWCQLMVKHCHIYLSYTRTASLNSPYISALRSHNALTLVILKNFTTSGHRFKREICIQAESVVLKFLTSVNCLSGHEYACEHCGISHGEENETSVSLLNQSCVFCHRFHLCGDFVAMLSGALELHVNIQYRNVNVLVFGAFLVSRESYLWRFAKIISLEGNTLLERIEEKPSKFAMSPSFSLSIEFVPPRSSKSNSAVNINLLRLPLESSLSASSKYVRFTNSLKKLSFKVKGLRTLSGCIKGTRHATHEIMIERLDVNAVSVGKKVDASLALSGIFVGFGQDLSEVAFLQSLYLCLRSIILSHSWLAPSRQANSDSAASRLMNGKSIQVAICLVPSAKQQDSAVRLVFLPIANAVPALVGSIGLTKFDVCLPPFETDYFNFVFEANTLRLDAIPQSLAAMPFDESESLNLKQEGGESFASLPISDLLFETASKWRLVEAVRFSAWCHANVVGFRISNVDVQILSVLLTNLHKRSMSGGGGAFVQGIYDGGWIRRRCFNTAATTSLNRFTVDGHLEALRLTFEASCGARIEYELAEAHCSASALPRCSPLSAPPSSTTSTAATAASTLHQQQSSESPMHFLEFTVSHSDLFLRLPEPPTSILSLPAFQVCCNLAQRSIEISLCQPVELRLDPGVHLCVIELLTLIRNLQVHYRAGTIDTPKPATSKAIESWNVAVHNTASVKLTYESGGHSATVLFSGIDAYAFGNLVMRIKSPKLTLLCDAREIALLQNFVLRKLPISDVHRKVAIQLATSENTCLEIQAETVLVIFAFNHKFYTCFEELVNVKEAMSHATSAKSPFFNELKAMQCKTEGSSSKSSSLVQLPFDLVFRVKKFTLKIKDDPFECKLSDDFMVLMDESFEQQKRIAALASQVEQNRLARSEPPLSAASAELQTYLRQLEYQRAVEYIARIRRFYSGYIMADDLFTWSVESACLHILADGAYRTPQNIIEEIQRLDDVSPWNCLQPSDFSHLFCRLVRLTVGRFQWQLRDYSKPLVDASEVTLTGSFAVATRRSVDSRCQRDCKVELGPPWQPSSIDVVRYVSPMKFFYELAADVKALSLCYGSNWEPTLAWLYLRLDDIRRASADPSMPPLGWWDRVRLNLHGRLGFTFAQLSWLYSTSLDPYNAHEFLTCHWTSCTLDWIPGRIGVNGDLSLFFQTASKYDGVCHVLQIPGLNFEISMDWLSFGNQFDHHTVMVVNGERLTPDVLPHDSYTAFRANRLRLSLAFSVANDSAARSPSCFVYTNLLKLFDRLKMCLTRISRPIRRGVIFNCVRPRKPLFGQLLQSLDISVRLPHLKVTYWVSYNKRLGISASSGALNLHATFGIHVEGEEEARTLTGAIVYVLPPRDSRRRIAPQWSLQVVDARLLNCRAWLLHRPDRTALHLISAAEDSDFRDGLPAAFLPNSELLIFKSIRFERGLRSQTDLPTQPVRVRITGLEGFSEEAVENTGSDETEELMKSSNEEFSSASPKRQSIAKSVLSHEDLEPVHRVTVENPKLLWNETNRNLVYTMINMYNHAWTLKKNLSAQAVKGISFELANTSSISSSSPLYREKGDGASTSSRDDSAELSKTSASVNADTLTEKVKIDYNSTTSSCANETSTSSWKEVPMLARLVKEAETAKFYAYCEEEPKQPDVLGQLQGLALCTSTPVLSRQWHIELVNCQVMLKPSDCSGYVIVSAAKARLDSVEHPPVWRDARLLAKCSLIGQMECMQYYATVGPQGLEASTPDQWLSFADVQDWMHLGACFSQDALSGRPEVVGSGHAVGGIVSALPSSINSTHTNAAAAAASAATAIQLQRMVSRCACQFVYVNYAPLAPNYLPPGQFVPPLPPPEDDLKIHQNQEGADTFTLLHRTLNACTNSVQYNMAFDIVNLLFYVEPQQKERFERNRVSLSLLGEQELRQAILRDQETLRGLVNTQRLLERELWAALRLFDRLLHSTQTTAAASASIEQLLQQPTSQPSPFALSSVSIPPGLAAQAEQILASEYRIGQLKASIVEKNSLLSQTISHFQKVHIQSQRLHGGKGVARAVPEGRLREGSSISASNSSKNVDRVTHPMKPPNGQSSSTTSIMADADATAMGSDARSAEGAVTVPVKADAEVVRRDEICFEHARWRMTEADGQIGLADVELRGFLYARTHRRDDSGSHWLQLGSMRVRSVAPNSFYKEVLMPDRSSSYHHTGGPMIRVTCTQRPPVGGISVKEVMEVSVAPLVLQISKSFYNQLMPFFFPERGNEDTSFSPAFEHVDAAETSASGSTDFVVSSEDLHLDTADSRIKRRSRYGGKIISRLDPKAWSGRLRSHPNKHHGHLYPQQRIKGAAESNSTEGNIPEANLTMKQVEGYGSLNSIYPELPLLPLDVMRERARTNQVFLYVKIPGFPIRLSYKGDKQKNLADVTNFELNIPMLEYHNRLWTWLDFVLEVKMRIRRQLIKEVIKQKLRPRRALSWYSGHSTSGDRISTIATDVADAATTTKDETSLVGRFHSNNSSSLAVVPTSSTAAIASSRREQQLLELILGRHAIERPNSSASGASSTRRRRFRVFR